MARQDEPPVDCASAWIAHGHVQRLVTWPREPAEAPSFRRTRWLRCRRLPRSGKKENLVSLIGSPFRLRIALKAKKKCRMYPDFMGGVGGQAPKRLPPEPYLTTPGVKIHFFDPPANVSAGAERHPVGWVPALPAGFLNTVKPRHVQEAHRATVWPIRRPE